MKRVILASCIILVCLVSTNETTCPASTTPPSTAKGSLLEGSRELALTLWKKLSSTTTSGNEFMSPLSIWLALMSLYFGAQGQSANDLYKVLRLTTTNKTTLSSELNRIMIGCSGTPPTEKGTTMRLSNRLYVQKNTTLCPGIAGFLSGSGNQNDPAVQQLDFAGNPDKARKEINAWIKKRTENKISDLLKQGDVTAMSKLVLANAAYFFGKWLREFGDPVTKKFHTRPQDPTSSTNTVDVPMLQNKERYRHVESAKFQSHIVEMPFLGGCYSFYVVLPVKPQTKVETVVDLLTSGGAKALLGELDSMKEIWINLTLPQFKIEREIELTSVLTELGLGVLFDPAKADLTGFNGEAGLFVSKVRHQALVDVKKDGVEAAAATAIVISTTSIQIPPPDILVLTFDRPFLFFIRDKIMDLIIFAGILRKP